jgi:DNA-binding response OmpR family regulator/HPt (histidine-containing phosphotransfer) domain-containing protein
MKILVVEDDQNSAAILLQLLAESHYAIDSVTNAETAWQYIETYAYDLIVLDVMLPDSSGIELCGKLRNAGYTIPVILLTARDSANDRVMGLEAGADDYVIKPYNFEELIARIRALLRRYSDRNTLPKELIWENLHLDFGTNRVTHNGQLLYLTQKEYRLLELFLRHPQQIFSRSSLLDRAWSAGEFPSEEAVTTQIKGLRQKLKAAGISQDPIETLYGLGYRLRTPPVAESQAIANLEDNLKENKPKENNSQMPEVRVKEIMALVTKKLQASLVDTIDMLQQLAIALQKGRLDPDLRQEGFMEAHRLIGSLGTLDFPAGSAIARQIEQMLTIEFPLVATDSGKLMQLIGDLQINTSDAAKGNQNQTEVKSESKSSSNLKLPQLLIVDDDKKFVLEIKLEAENLGIVVQSAYDLATARLQIANSAPDLILLDILFPDRPENRSKNGLTLLNELADRQPQIPTVMMTASGGLSDRVVSARDGICAFIEKPISAADVVHTITKILNQKFGDRHKVMVVDDDPHMLTALQILLGKWDLEVMILQDSQEFWQVLETFSPDLLVLDLIMPKYSGIDLCRAVRTSSLWFDLPIMFLSSQSDRETIREIFAAGADDYLSKPIVEEDLQIRIISRLERKKV